MKIYTKEEIKKLKSQVWKVTLKDKNVFMKAFLKENALKGFQKVDMSITEDKLFRSKEIINAMSQDIIEETVPNEFIIVLNPILYE